MMVPQVEHKPSNSIRVSEVAKLRLSYEGSGCPSRSQSDENVEKVPQVIYEDRRRTINGVCTILGLSYSTYRGKICALSAE
jgi:hypothetical protein